MALMLCGAIAGRATGADRRLGPPRFWASGIASSPRIPLIGDVDGDGRADVLALDPSGDGSLDVMLTSSLGKARAPVRALDGFGKGAVAAVCARFRPYREMCVLALCADGTARLAHDFDPATHRYREQSILLQLPPDVRPATPVLAHTVSRPYGEGPDVLIVGADGRCVLLRHIDSTDGGYSLHDRPLFLRLPRIRRMTFLRLSEEGWPVLIWMNDRGDVFRSQFGFEDGNDEFDLPPRTQRLLHASPSAQLAAGRFTGGSTDDLLVGQLLLPGGDPARAVTVPGLPTVAQAATDAAWLVGDFDASGHDALLRVKRSKDRFTSDDLILYPSQSLPDKQESVERLASSVKRPFQETKGDREEALNAQRSTLNAFSDDNDGLPEDWKTGRVKPGGLDLAALGCRPGHRDVIVEVQRIEDVSDDLVHREMERVVRYYAALPIANSDGTPGIALHVIYREPIPLKEASESWYALADRYHAAARRGITHWMMVYNGGGGQSDEMGDQGSCGAHALYATFLHEFGHQLGLDHTGRWGPSWCPIYPSLMNYAYSYQLNGKPDQIGYSDGRLARVVLDERRLSERLPLPPDQVAFLAGPPYHYRLKPTPDGRGTLVDWNWNGVFGEANIAADINYGYSTNAGERNVIGKTYTAPVLLTYGSGAKARLLCFCGLLPTGAKPPPTDLKADHPGLSADQPGRLMVRVWRGGDPIKEGKSWSEETSVEPEGVIGDATAAYGAGAAWVAYSTASGVVVRRITLDAGGRPQVGAPAPVPDSRNAQPTLVALAGRLALFLWRGPQAQVGLRLGSGEEGAAQFGTESACEFKSVNPIGAVEAAPMGGLPSVWIATAADQDARRPGRWQVRHLLLHPDGTLHEISCEWVGGEAGGQRGRNRPTLLWQPDRALGPNGQLWVFYTGYFGTEHPIACHYVSTRIADKSVNGGWLERRYYDEWTESRSAPGACFFKGEIRFALRWFGDSPVYRNDDLMVAFFGSGIEREPMGDFDDIGFIRDIGMSHSIPYVSN
jgi:hypothetical protein